MLGEFSIAIAMTILTNHPWFQRDQPFAMSAAARERVVQMDMRASDQDHAISIVSKARQDCMELQERLTNTLSSQQVNSSVASAIAAEWFEESRRIDGKMIEDLIGRFPTASDPIMSSRQRHSFQKVRAFLPRGSSFVVPSVFQRAIAEECGEIVQEVPAQEWIDLSESCLRSVGPAFVLMVSGSEPQNRQNASVPMSIAQDDFVDNLDAQFFAYIDRLVQAGCDNARETYLCMRYPDVYVTTPVDTAHELLLLCGVLSDSDQEAVRNIMTRYRAQRSAFRQTLVEGHLRWNSGPVRRAREERIAELRERGESWLPIVEQHHGLPALRGLHALEESTMSELRDAMSHRTADLSLATRFALGVELE